MSSPMLSAPSGHVPTGRGTGDSFSLDYASTTVRTSSDASEVLTTSFRSINVSGSLPGEPIDTSGPRFVPQAEPAAATTQSLACQYVFSCCDILLLVSSQATCNFLCTVIL